MVVRPITWWGIPPWDCTKRLWRSSVLSGLLHQGFFWRISPASFLWKPLHLLWAWIELVNRCSQNNELLIHSHCKWCGLYLSWVSATSLFRRLHRPHFYRVAQIWAGCWPCWVGNFYESYNWVDSLKVDSVLQSPSLVITPCSEQSHFRYAF